jgi:hypothetical protein
MKKKTKMTKAGKLRNTPARRREALDLAKLTTRTAAGSARSGAMGRRSGSVRRAPHRRRKPQ